MTIQARFSSICPKCNRRISVGERVIWSKGSKAMHVFKCDDMKVEAPEQPEAPASTLNPGELIAKFASRCKVCGNDIHPGQTIARPQGKGAYAHVECCGDTEDLRSGDDGDPTVASRAEQQDTYHDVGPQAWDDIPSYDEPGDDFDF